MRNGMKLSSTLVVLGAVALAGTVRSEQYAFTGSRASGMGGANAASTKDATAQWHNPAAFGFMGEEENDTDNNGLSDKDWGWNLIGFSAGYTMTEDMGHYLDILTDIDFENIDNASVPENVSHLVAMAAALSGVDGPGNALYVDSSVGSSMRIGSFGIGFRVFGEAAAWVNELDTANLGLAADVPSLNTELDTARGADGFNAGAYMPQYLDIGALTGANLSNDNAEYLDFKIGELLANGTLEQSDIDGASALLTDIVNATGAGDLDDNLTSVVARGFAVAEIPVSYGHSFGDHLSVGVTAKAMFGKVLGTKVWVFDEDNLDNAVEGVTDSEAETLSFGLDVGVLYRINNFQFAAVGHNLNRPTFDGYTDTIMVNESAEQIVVPDVEIDPQITLGAAFIPSKRLMLEVNYDMLETGTLLDGYDIQRLSVGGELDVWLLALRVGAYNNLAESSQDWVATAGVGINIFGVRADVGGAYSLGDNAEYDGQEIPTEARLFASIGFDF